MKIEWFYIPAHGHINPTLGLVRALTNAGHQIYYFSFEMEDKKMCPFPIHHILHYPA